MSAGGPEFTPADVGGLGAEWATRTTAWTASDRPYARRRPRVARPPENHKHRGRRQQGEGGGSRESKGARAAELSTDSALRSTSAEANIGRRYRRFGPRRRLCGERHRAVSDLAAPTTRGNTSPRAPPRPAAQGAGPVPAMAR